MSQKVYVGNLGFSVTNQELTDMFSKFGTVTSAKIVLDRDTSRSKGFGFVEMSTSEEASSAINSLNGKQLSGRALNVTEAKPALPRDASRLLKSRF